MQILLEFELLAKGALFLEEFSLLHLPLVLPNTRLQGVASLLPGELLKSVVELRCGFHEKLEEIGHSANGWRL